MTGSGSDAAREVAGLTAALSRIADGLYRIDGEPECRLLREPSSLEGVSATIAAGLAGAFERVWTEYPLLKQEADEHAADPAALLATAFPSRVHRLEADVTAILDAAAKIGEAWRSSLPRVEELQRVVGDVTREATTIGMDGDDQLVQARRLVDHLARQTARDPLSVDSRPATRAVAQVADRIGALARLRASLPSDLAAARAMLDELRVAVVEGRTAIAEARARISRPDGLLEPLDARRLEEGDLALAPWLARLETESSRGQWLVAARGLEQWRSVARGWLHNAERVVAANRGPVERRNELRGRLDAYRAKAGATGRAEDRTLTEALQRARTALYSAPCDLEEAERLVHDYGRQVSAR